MNLRLEGESGNYFEVTKSDHYGYILTEYKPTKEGSKNPYTEYKLFYANLEQVASKLIWLGVAGNTLQEVLDNLKLSVDKLTESLQKLA
jgi:hypothetical protein